MWVIFALLSALFAGITTILSKIGVKNVGSDTATAIRTVVVLIFSWIVVFLFGGEKDIPNLSAKTVLFLVLSGLATGGSWLCYFKALKIGDVNKVVPIDKSSTILTMIIAFIFLHEKITVLKVICMVLITLGTYMMIENKKEQSSASFKSNYLVWAVLSAIFAALTSILGKIGVSGINSSLGTAIRTIVVLIPAWCTAIVREGSGNIKTASKKDFAFLVLSGITTGLSWLCYYKALRDGQASIVAPIDKLSILVTIAFSRIVLKERLTKKSASGLVLLTAGTLLLLI